MTAGPIGMSGPTGETGKTGKRGMRGRPAHQLSAGWAIALAVIVVVAGLGAYFIRQQIEHNANTIDTLKRDAAALKTEVDRARRSECSLLNGRREAFYQIALLEASVVADPVTPPNIKSTALDAERSIVKQLSDERLPGCHLAELPGLAALAQH